MGSSAAVVNRAHSHGVHKVVIAAMASGQGADGGVLAVAGVDHGRTKDHGMILAPWLGKGKRLYQDKTEKT